MKTRFAGMTPSPIATLARRRSSRSGRSRGCGRCWRGWRGRLVPQHALTPVAKSFGADPFPDIACKHRAKFTDDVRLLHVLTKQPVQTRAGLVSAQVDLVLPG